MDKKSAFEKDGKHYEILQANIEFYVAKNGSHCIRLQGDSKPIAIGSLCLLQILEIEAIHIAIYSKNKETLA